MGTVPMDSNMGNDRLAQEKHTLKVKGVWIPVRVFFDNDLTDADIKIFSIIYLLDGKNGCFATNGYIGNILNYSNRTVSSSITILIDKGYISRNMEMVPRFRSETRVLRVLPFAHEYRSPLLPPDRSDLPPPIEGDFKQIDKRDRQKVLVPSKDGRDEFSKTENSRETEYTLGSNNDTTNSVSETKAKPLGQKSNAGTLRSMSKSPEVKQRIKSKPWIVPKANVPYWEIMKQYKFKVPQKPEANIYKIVDSLITDLRKGEYFNSIPEYNSLANRKITPEDFKRFYEHFTLVAFSPRHYPVNPVTKRAYRNWYFDRMLMNNGHSAFATYLDSPPKLTTDNTKPLNDPTPNYTNFLINILKEKLEWDLDNGNRAKVIDAVTKLNSTFERLEPKISNYGYFCGDFYKRAKLLVEMFESHQDRGIPIRPEYINTDKTHSIFIPEYMERVGLIKS